MNKGKGVGQHMIDISGLVQQWEQEVDQEERSQIQQQIAVFREEVGNAFTSIKRASDAVVLSVMILFESFEDAKEEEMQNRAIMRVKPIGKCGSVRDLAKHVTTG